MPKKKKNTAARWRALTTANATLPAAAAAAAHFSGLNSVCASRPESTSLSKNDTRKKQKKKLQCAPGGITPFPASGSRKGTGKVGGGGETYINPCEAQRKRLCVSPVFQICINIDGPHFSMIPPPRFSSQAYLYIYILPAPSNHSSPLRDRVCAHWSRGLSVSG